jgi:hypothetical protein
LQAEAAKLQWTLWAYQTALSGLQPIIFEAAAFAPAQLLHVMLTTVDKECRPPPVRCYFQIGQD